MTTLSTRPAPAIPARLVKEVDVATGEVVPQDPPPFCAFCCVNTPKLLACSRCGESFRPPKAALEGPQEGLPVRAGWGEGGGERLKGKTLYDVYDWTRTNTLRSPNS